MSAGVALDAGKAVMRIAACDERLDDLLLSTRTTCCDFLGGRARMYWLTPSMPITSTREELVP